MSNLSRISNSSLEASPQQDIENYKRLRFNILKASWPVVFTLILLFLVAPLSGENILSSDSPAWNLVGLISLSTLVVLVTNLPGVPAVMMHLAVDVAVTTNLPLLSVLMAQILAFSSVFLSYQAPPLIAAMHIGKLSFSDVGKFV